MAASLTKPFLIAPHNSTGSLHSPSLLPSRNIIQLPARRSQLKRLGLTTGSPIKVYSETSQACIGRPSRASGLRPKLDAEKSGKFACGILVKVLLKKYAGTDDAEKSGKFACGILVKDLLKKYAGTDILAYVSQVHKVVLPETLVDHETLTYDQIKGSAIRCPNPEYAEKMIAAIEAVRVRGDSVGCTVTCIVRNFPRSSGSRAFQEIAAELAKSVVFIRSGFEIGSGFTGASITTDSEYTDESGQSGGIQGGIIKMRVAVNQLLPTSRMKNTVSGGTCKVEEYFECARNFCSVAGVITDLVEVMVAHELVCKLVAEGVKCLMSPTNAASQEPLESPESAIA